MTTISVPLDRLHERHSGLTEALGRSYTEAASVCYARFHRPPVTVGLNYDGQERAGTLQFTTPDERTNHAYANEIDATEAGAYGVSLAAVEVLAGLVAVRRAETLTGADWYVAPIGTGAEDLEDCIRLEVSGTSGGSSAEVRRRLKQKIDQTSRGSSNLPALASVVGFEVCEILVAALGAKS
jgi:hypothetical protein